MEMQMQPKPWRKFLEAHISSRKSPAFFKWTFLLLKHDGSFEKPLEYMADANPKRYTHLVSCFARFPLVEKAEAEAFTAEKRKQFLIETLPFWFRGFLGGTKNDVVCPLKKSTTNQNTQQLDKKKPHTLTFKPSAKIQISHHFGWVSPPPPPPPPIFFVSLQNFPVDVEEGEEELLCPPRESSSRRIHFAETMRLHGGVAPILFTEAVPGRPGFGG